MSNNLISRLGLVISFLNGLSKEEANFIESLDEKSDKKLLLFSIDSLEFSLEDEMDWLKNDGYRAKSSSDKSRLKHCKDILDKLHDFKSKFIYDEE